MTRFSTPHSISDGSCSSAALKNISPGRNITTNSGVDATLVEVALRRRAARCAPRTCCAWSGEQLLARLFVRRLERAQVGVERRLGVDDDLLAAGQPHDRRPAGSGHRRRRLNRALLGEIAVLDHPGELDDALQLQLAPAAADAGPLEGVGQPARFVAQALAGGVERRRSAACSWAPFSTRRRSESLISRSTCSSVLRHRRQQILDRLLAGVDVRRSPRCALRAAAFRPARGTLRCWS